MNSNRKLKLVVIGHIIKGDNISLDGLKASIMDYLKPLSLYYVLNVFKLYKDNTR